MLMRSAVLLLLPGSSSSFRFVGVYVQVVLSRKELANALHHHHLPSHRLPTTNLPPPTFPTLSFAFLLHFSLHSRFTRIFVTHSPGSPHSLSTTNKTKPNHVDPDSTTGKTTRRSPLTHSLTHNNSTRPIHTLYGESLETERVIRS